jgi:thiamine biosynthesis lipoprotein
LENIGYDRDFKDINSDPAKKDSLDVRRLRNNLSGDLKTDGQKIFFGCRMDFSGIVKGYATDKLVDYLGEKGYENFLVDSGGDIRVYGKDENGKNWKISLEGVAEEKILLELNDDFPAIATSGITRRKWENKSGKFHHLINPKKPEEFSFNLKSVTVAAETCEKADVWAKTLYLMGKEKGMDFSGKNDIKSLFWDYRGNIFISLEMKDNIKKYA